MGIIHSFPQLFFCHQMLDALGECHGAPSKQSLMSLCVPELQNVTWDDVMSYLQGIACHTRKDYLPFLSGRYASCTEEQLRTDSTLSLTVWRMKELSGLGHACLVLDSKCVCTCLQS